MLDFKPIALDFNHGDEEAMLVLRSERLVAIVVHLGHHHGEAAGQWFVETIFGENMPITGRSYKTLDDISDAIETS
jgi:hypothetical protein